MCLFATACVHVCVYGCICACMLARVCVLARVRACVFLHVLHVQSLEEYVAHSYVPATCVTGVRECISGNLCWSCLSLCCELYTCTHAYKIYIYIYMYIYMYVCWNSLSR